MVKRGVWAGICTVPNRFAKANNKYMKGSYDSDKPLLPTFIQITYTDRQWGNLYQPSDLNRWMKKL